MPDPNVHLCLLPREDSGSEFPNHPHVFCSDDFSHDRFAYGLPINFTLNQLLFRFRTYFQARSFEGSPTFSDWAVTCAWFSRPFGAVLSGILSRCHHKFKLLLKTNIIVIVIVYLCLSFGWTEKPVLAPFLFLIGFNEGISENCCLVALLSLVNGEDRLLLYAFYGLRTAISGDFGIAVSLPTESALNRSKLRSRLKDYPNGDEIIRKSLESLNYIRELPTHVRRYIIDAFITPTESAFAISFGVFIVFDYSQLTLHLKQLTTEKQQSASVPED
ncbi:hypothetical protein K458DRAFT_399128 [Lentithecium fluviatile CBS 122367]|uniref:MFS general substrate transporter n=1 Tax=Lentithecium fluviatile CBS 122367 TaxID=1168545 RepID=A0A6G1JKY1_9PLEO|nr:hypothetical protein K458DRAFT_399128 [Lentithecium fluviatile CBS 122367]